VTLSEFVKLAGFSNKWLQVQVIYDCFASSSSILLFALDLKPNTQWAGPSPEPTQFAVAKKKKLTQLVRVDWLVKMQSGYLPLKRKKPTVAAGKKTMTRELCHHCTVRFPFVESRTVTVVQLQ